MHWKFLLAGLALVTAFGCGGGGSDATTAPSTGGGTTVTVGNNFFSPGDVSVAQGTTVTCRRSRTIACSSELNPEPAGGGPPFRSASCSVPAWYVSITAGWT